MALAFFKTDFFHPYNQILLYYTFSVMPVRFKMVGVYFFNVKGNGGVADNINFKERELEFQQTNYVGG